MILSYYVVDLGLKASPQKRGKYYFASSLTSSLLVLMEFRDLGFCISQILLHRKLKRPPQMKRFVLIDIPTSFPHLVHTSFLMKLTNTFTVGLGF